MLTISVVSDDDSFWDHDLNEYCQNLLMMTLMTTSHITAADIPVQDAAAAVAGRLLECAGRVVGRVAGHAAAKSISLMLIIIYWLMLFVE